MPNQPSRRGRDQQVQRRRTRCDLQPIARPVPSEPTDGELHALLLAYFRAELDPDEATELLRIADARHQ